MCATRLFRHKKKKKSGKAAPKPRERENIEYKISYFIINIPFSVPSFSSYFVCLFRSGELALIGWKIFFQSDFPCTHIHSHRSGRFFLGRQDNKRKDSTFYAATPCYTEVDGPESKNLNSEREKKKHNSFWLCACWRRHNPLLDERNSSRRWFT